MVPTSVFTSMLPAAVHVSSIFLFLFSSLASAAIADLVASSSSRSEDGQVVVCVVVFQLEARSINTLSCCFACKSHYNAPLPGSFSDINGILSWFQCGH